MLVQSAGGDKPHSWQRLRRVEQLQPLAPSQVKGSVIFCLCLVQHQNARRHPVRILWKTLGGNQRPPANLLTNSRHLGEAVRKTFARFLDVRRQPVNPLPELMLTCGFLLFVVRHHQKTQPQGVALQLLDCRVTSGSIRRGGKPMQQAGDRMLHEGLLLRAWNRCRSLGTVMSGQAHQRRL